MKIRLEAGDTPRVMSHGAQVGVGLVIKKLNDHQVLVWIKQEGETHYAGQFVLFGRRKSPAMRDQSLAVASDGRWLAR